MAYKKRLTNSGVLIEFSHIEMLKVEKLLKRLSEADGKEAVFVSSEENEWLSNALDLFAPEPPEGKYPI